MTTVLRKVEKFDGSKEEWTQYVECVNHFFDANDIADTGKKRAVLLSITGPSMYALLRSLLSPAKLVSSCPQKPLQPYPVRNGTTFSF